VKKFWSSARETCHKKTMMILPSHIFLMAQSLPQMEQVTEKLLPLHNSVLKTARRKLQDWYLILKIKFP
jgi:hypothetical protein